MQPKGFVKQWHENLVCRSKKALLGLKQELGSWYEEIDSIFLQHGFLRSKNDPNIYSMYDEHGKIILISLYMDEMIIKGNADALIKEIKV